MLPISLKLRNFLSYREDVPTLHLENVHVACLCGANGHGKSALLDAMTWALWGRARGQRQEQLLHQGQQEMQVDLEFEVSGQRYKAVRRYSKTRRTGTSALDLHIWAGESYRPITGDTISATQAHIQRLINMDYETFVNSAFLLQGRADIFTMSTPAQRKEVLGKVLGLGLYDRLEDRAKAHARDANAALETAGAVMQRLQEQAARQPEVKAAKEQSETELATAQQLLTSLDGRLELLVKQVTTLEQRRQEVQAQEDQRRQAAARAKEAEAEVVTLRTRLDGWREVLAREEQIAAGMQELTSARNRLTALQGTVQRVREFEGALHGHEQRIAGAKATLESDVRALERRVSQELAPIVESLPSLEVSLGQAEQAVSAIGAESVELGMLQQRYQELVLEKRGLEEENARIERGGKEIGAKIAMLGHSHQPDVACPLCGSALGPEAMARIETHLKVRSLLEKHEEFIKALTQANTEKSKFLGIASHDLKNPLISINGLSSLLASGKFGALSSSQAEMVSSIYEASEAMLALVDDLFDVALIETGQLNVEIDEVDLNSMVKTSVNLYRVTAEKKDIEIDFVGRDVPEKVLCDKRQVRRVMDNLLSNAIKFSEPGTTISVILESDHDWVFFRVADEGPGIPVDEFDKLFGSFSKTSVNPTGGETSTGLGLNICKKVMEAHGGEIYAENLPEKGAQFSVQLHNSAA